MANFFFFFCAKQDDEDFLTFDWTRQLDHYERNKRLVKEFRSDGCCTVVRARAALPLSVMRRSGCVSLYFSRYFPYTSITLPFLRLFALARPTRRARGSLCGTCPRAG